MQKMKERFCIVVTVAVMMLLVIPGMGGAEEKKFPTKPIYLVVPYGPGGGTDVPARALASTVPEFLNNQPAIVVNKPGSGGLLGPKFVASQEPDGYTLLMAWGGPEYIFQRHVRSLPIDVFGDFKPIMGLLRYSSCIAVPSDSPFKDLHELVKYAKENPNKLKFTHTGAGGEHQINAFSLMKEADIKMVDVPSDGGVDARNLTAGGHVDVGFFATFLTPPVSDKIRVLAVSFPNRDKMLPNVPTVNELGYNVVNAVAFNSIAAPAGTPDWKIKILYEAFGKATKHKAYISIINKLHFEILNWGPEETLRQIKKQDQMYKKLADDLNLSKK
jgi:tripartite-type tricarboxylate transporter receptor subunit TctC